MNLIVTFIVLSFINVIFSTIRSITTIKSSWLTAAIISAGYFSFYTVMIIYTVSDFGLEWKCGITFVANLVGVAIVKIVEKKMRKDKLWKIEVTFNLDDSFIITELLKKKDIPYRLSVPTNKWCFFEIYCDTQSQTSEVATIIKKYNGKYFVSENRAVL